MEFIQSHLVLITPFVAAGIAQSYKIYRKSLKHGLSWRDFATFTYAGMPSGHTALVSSTVTIIALTEGLYSTIFAFSFVFAMIVINDALRLRKYLGQHGEVLNDLVKDLRDDSVLELRYPRLLEKIGHTKLEVIAGATLGIVISFISYLIFA